MTRISWHSLARRELFEASAFYDGESAGLGDIFLDSVQQALDSLRQHPRAGHRVLLEIRRYLVPRFPYSLFYRIETEGPEERLFLLAVSHQKRRPRHWAGRA